MGPGEERGYCLGEGYQRGLLFSTSDSLLRPLICYDLVELFLSCIFSGGNPNYFLLLRHCQAGCNCNPESALMVTMPRNIIWPWQKSTSTLPSSRTINIRLKLRIITDSLKCITTETSEQCFVFLKKTILFPLKQNNQILQLTQEVYLYGFTVKEAAHADILPSIVLHFRNTTHVLYSWN